jgi:23S rRNA (pseudouridine1915-N3)-methyltransferase
VQLSQQLVPWQQDGRDVAFLIGGADGRSGFKAGADTLIRISSMTLPHGMVRVMLAEQLYRAWSIAEPSVSPRLRRPPAGRRYRLLTSMAQ